ncbi:MAG TPA: biotin-dependent carboxyltransferase family protein [Hyphomicrobiaceae bacterium]|nr:biotin-dependent carboxyltransferase family protein [Hyphomicrobiaceae bacterium]
MTPALSVLSAGLLTTVQDKGRVGYQHLGIPVSGALDMVSLSAANLLVGNGADTAALEIAYQGPTLAVEADSVRLACAGASTPIDILPGGDAARARRLHMFTSARLERGDQIRIGALSGGAVLYLAAEGGFDLPVVLGSRSTLLRAGIGGLDGRALAAGDRVRLCRSRATTVGEVMLAALDLSPPPFFRIILGPQDDYFTAEALGRLTAESYWVTPASDRMGMRLTGARLAHSKGYNIISDAIAPGTVQVPGNGLPIVLLADRQTTGGYPKIATVISADLAALGRLTPGQQVRFQRVDIEAAEAACRTQAAFIASLSQKIVPAAEPASVDETALQRANLVSGMIDALAGEA